MSGRWQRNAGWVALLSCVSAMLVAGVCMEGYSHALHPLGLPGAHGVRGALAFNLAGFVLPGLLAAVIALVLYRVLPADAGWLPRIGARMLLLSALAFAAQGVLRLHPTDLDGAASGLHAAAWMLWCVGFVPGALLLALALRGTAVAAVIAVLAVLLALLPLPGLPDPPLLQRVALGAWLLWLALVPWLAGRGVRQTGG